MTVNLTKHEYRAIPGDMTFDEARYPSPRVIYSNATSRNAFCRRTLSTHGEPGMRYHLSVRRFAGWEPLGSTFPEIHRP